MIRAESRRDTLLSLAAMATLIVWAWQRLNFFAFSRTVATPDGTVTRLPNALATVDHPFHAARFHVFLDTLEHSGLPRWVFSHQGGYPAEFYPFGSSVVDLFVWAISLGQMSVPMVHTWAVALVFAAPAIGFWAVARLAGLAPWIGPVALAVHVCVRGWWWSGGSRELVEWGLITNVLAAALVFLALAAIGARLAGGSRRWLLAAALLLAWAEYTNPRSLIAILAVAAGAGVVWAIEAPVRARIGRLDLLPAVICLGLCAPLLIPLFRYRDQYYFVHYSGYADLGEWIDSSIQAISGPGFAFAIAGLVIALIAEVSVVERLVAWSLVAYAGTTSYLVVVDWPGALTEQLETTRLMPFQRLLMIALAAIAVGRVSSWLAPRWSWAACAAVAVLIPVLYVLSPPGFIPKSDQGLVRAGTMADPAIADLRSAVRAADAEAPDNTAILILGSTVSWHDQFWSVIWSDRLFYYDDWLWYWQREHVGDYDPKTEHAYPDDASTIDPEYLAAHGIGAVIVTGQAQAAAASAPFLDHVRTGSYDVYPVRDPSSLATLDGANLDTTRSHDDITVTGIAAGGTVTIRENWFPRWRASVDGTEIPVVHRADGYMDITVPVGSERMVVTYSETGLDWIARLIAFASALSWIVLFYRSRGVLQLGGRLRMDQVARPG
jgi:hypothetical protein